MSARQPSVGPRRRRGGGLLAKLMVTLIVAGLPGLLGLGSLAFYDRANALRAELVEEPLGFAADARASAIGAVLAGGSEDVRVMARLSTVVAFGQGVLNGSGEGAAERRAAVVRDFQAFATTHPEYRRFSYIAPDGHDLVRVTCVADQGTVSDDIQSGEPPDAFWSAEVARLKPDAVYQSRYGLMRTNGTLDSPYRPSVSYATPVYDSAGQHLAGVVLIALDLTDVLDRARGRSAWGQVMVTDWEGWFLAHPDRTREWGAQEDLGTGYSIRSEVPADALQAMMGSRLRRATVGSTAYAYAVARPTAGGRGDLTVLCTAPVGERTARAIGNLRVRMVALAGVGFVLPLLGGMVLMVFFLRAVPRLREATRRIAAGDLDHRVTVRTGDEMEDLANDLNTMAQRLSEMAHLERMVELEKLKDDLTSMIVHDLRSPLAAVISSLKTIERVDCDPEVVRSLLPYCLLSGDALMSLINDLLDIKTMEDGALRLVVAEADVPALAREALTLLGGLAAEHGVHVWHQAPEGCPRIMCDSEKILRVIVNLVANGIKFTHSGGRVGVLVGTSAGGGVHISVVDTGAGIPPEYLDRIFDKFAQVESRSAGGMVSTGLGLTFCKMVTEAHGGRIWVESEVGKGSAFHVELPPAPPNSGTPPSAVPGPGA